MGDQIRTEIAAEISCPDCGTKINIEDIKYAIKLRIENAIDEVIKTI